MTEKQITLERWGFPNGVTNAAAAMPDGYWTPWHIAQAEIARLTAERDEWRYKYNLAIAEWANDFKDHSEDLAKRCEYAETELEKCREDAARYRWLRDHGRHAWYANEIIDLLDDGGRMDRTIDAARRSP